MVGVPGRSKGCAECRKRKKGCDLKTPSCTRCLRAHVPCPGYDNGRAFIMVTPSGAPPVAVSKAALRPKMENLTLQASFMQSAFKENYLSKFWDIYIHTGGHSPSRNRRVRQHVGAWVPAAWDLHQTDPALHKSLLALSLTIVGQKENKEWMVAEGLKLHCSALLDLNQGLGSPEKAKSEPFLLAARTLGIYEVMYSVEERHPAAVNRGRGWRGHHQGLLGMFLERTPEMHIEGRGHDLFVDARIVMTTDSILARKQSPLSGIRWKTVPWTKRAKLPKDFLFDILNDIAGLLESADIANWCQDPVKKAQLKRQVIQDCWNIDSDLTWWFNSFGSHEQIANLLSWGFASPTTADFPVAHLTCAYWAACILTYATLRLAVSPATLADLPDRTDPRVYCKNIIDIFEVFFHPTAGEFWIHSLVFPFGIAFVFLLATEPDWDISPSPEAEKMAGYLGRGELSRLRIRPFIKSLIRAACPRVAMYDRSSEAESGGAESGDDGLVALSRAWFGIEPVIPAPPSDLGSDLSFDEMQAMLEMTAAFPTGEDFPLPGHSPAESVLLSPSTLTNAPGGPLRVDTFG